MRGRSPLEWAFPKPGLAMSFEVVACAAMAFLVHVGLCRAAGIPVPFVVLPALALALLTLHAAVGLAFARRPGARLLLLVVLPSVLALLPLVHRRFGARGLMLLLIVTGVVAILPGQRRSAVDSAVASTLGGALAFPIALGSLHDYALRVGLRVDTDRTSVLFAFGIGLVCTCLAWRPSPSPSLRSPGFRVAVGVLGFAGGALVGDSPAHPRPEVIRAVDPPPSVLIVLDTVRADHLHAYGYRRDTMPRLEQFARTHMVRVERSVASSSSSLPTHGSMFTGLLPSFHGGHGPTIEETDRSRPLHPLRRDWPTLAQLLGRAGYWTVAIAANYGHLDPVLGLGRGFAWYDARCGELWRFSAANPYRGGLAHFPLSRLDRWAPFSAAEYFEESLRARRASEVVDDGLVALREARNSSFFLFLNLFDAHSPYHPPVRAKDLYPGVRMSYSRHEPTAADMLGRLEARGPAGAEKDLETLVDRYDSQLRFMDSELDRLLQALAKHPRFQEMMIVVTSDHGEAFGEHGVVKHGCSLHDEVVRVPLFVKAGRRHPDSFTPGGSVPGPFQSVDIFPTFLDHAGLTPPRDIDGLAWGQGRTLTVAEEFPDPAAMKRLRASGSKWRELRVSEADGWKAIVSTTGRKELYELASDPGENRNLSDQRGDVLSVLERALSTAFTNRVVSRPDGRAKELPPELIRSLRALGYIN